MIDSSLFFLFIAILMVGGLVFCVILLTQNRKYNFNIEKYQIDFLKIENSLDKDNPLTCNMAVVNADKLLDKAMHEMGVPGKTMGDRLKKIGPRFTQLNAVWHAHKLRNQVAHEHDFNLGYNQAKHALSVYRQALKDLGAI